VARAVEVEVPVVDTMYQLKPTDGRGGRRKIPAGPLGVSHHCCINEVAIAATTVKRRSATRGMFQALPSLPIALIEDFLDRYATCISIARTVAGRFTRL
jgi:hypothetical protein